ncbi:unnamed protein product [Lactuca saligna]|uniref:Uncharacterized protein n=1 Tax=Lactuca saligna TaxID=75948 RepID=A0AA35ZZM0_LACSI|nr:unnamed protein product [Lactuca saligna]
METCLDVNLGVLWIMWLTFYVQEIGIVINHQAKEMNCGIFKDEEVWVIMASKPKYIPGLILKEKMPKGFETHVRHFITNSKSGGNVSIDSVETLVAKLIKADEHVKKYRGKLGHLKRLAEIEVDRLFTELCEKDFEEIVTGKGGETHGEPAIRKAIIKFAENEGFQLTPESGNDGALMLTMNEKVQNYEAFKAN